MNIYEASKLANDLIKQYLPSGWAFKFNGGKRMFGQCDFRNKTIKLSRTLTELNSEEEIKDTILHEIAHALAPRGAKHNYKWKRVARSIGCKAKRYKSGVEAILAPPNFIYVCLNCGNKREQYRRSTKKLWACKKCCDKFNNGKFSMKYIFQLKK